MKLCRGMTLLEPQMSEQPSLLARPIEQKVSGSQPSPALFSNHSQALGTEHRPVS